MPKLKRLSGAEVVRILEQFGFQVYSQRGSHIKLRRVSQSGKETLTAPNHRQLDTGTCRAIYQQEKLDAALEGQKLTLILVEDSKESDQPQQAEVEHDERKRRFLEKSKNIPLSYPLTISSIEKKPMSDRVFLDTNL
jgi:predicted RNA binding protein YcfA (HicA-like mRNA interferase family)